MARNLEDEQTTLLAITIFAIGVGSALVVFIGWWL